MVGEEVFFLASLRLGGFSFSYRYSYPQIAVAAVRAIDYGSRR
jgi:hypothetical protein